MKIPIAGGRARHRGVSFYGQRYVATALQTDSGIVTHIKRRKKMWNKLFIDRVPFLRGVFRLIEMLWLAGWLGKFALLYLLLWFSLIPWQSGGAVVWTDYKAWIAIALVLSWIRFASIGKYHGAEHKVFNALLEEKPLRLDQVKTSSRVTRHCGTNLVVIYFVAHTLFSLFLAAPLAFLFSFSIAWEIFLLGHKKWVFPLIALGNALQRHVVTTEPNDRQLAVALEAMRALLQAEQDQ